MTAHPPRDLRKYPRPSPEPEQPPDDAPAYDGRDYGEPMDPHDPGAFVDPGDSGPPAFDPSPFVWRDPATIAPRAWLYGHHLIRKYASATIAPGGVGKSTLTLIEALAMATGRDLLESKPHGQLRVWVWNGEDPRDEIERRLTAAVLHYGIDPEEIGDRLFIDSGRDTPIKIGQTTPGGPMIAWPIVEALTAAIRERRIDVLIIDPFVSVHAMPENDNSAMDAAVKAFALVADRTGCAIDLVHHTRKLNGAEADMDAARGGSAIAGAVRAARALNPMSEDNARDFGIPGDERRAYVRVDDAKANLAPPGKARWFQLIGQPLGNATESRPQDFVAVARPWVPPDAFDAVTTADLLRVQQALHGQGALENIRANDWAGHIVGDVLDIDSTDDAGKTRIKALLKAWLRSGALVVKRVYDTQKGREANNIEVGEWASPQ